MSVVAQAAMLRIVHTGEEEVVLLAIAERCRSLQGLALPVDFFADVDVDAIRLEQDTARVMMAGAGGWVSFTLRQGGRVHVQSCEGGDGGGDAEFARVMEAAPGAPVRFRLKQGRHRLRFDR